MENQGNLTRRDDKVWLKTYEELGLEYDIELPADNTSLIDIFEKKASLKMLIKLPISAWVHR